MVGGQGEVPFEHFIAQSKAIEVFQGSLDIKVRFSCLGVQFGKLYLSIIEGKPCLVDMERL